MPLDPNLSLSSWYVERTKAKGILGLSADRSKYQKRQQVVYFLWKRWKTLADEMRVREFCVQRWFGPLTAAEKFFLQARSTVH